MLPTNVRLAHVAAEQSSEVIQSNSKKLRFGRSEGIHAAGKGFIAFHAF